VDRPTCDLPTVLGGLFIDAIHICDDRRQYFEPLPIVITFPPRAVRSTAIAMSMSLSVCPLAQLENFTAELQISVHVASVLL